MSIKKIAITYIIKFCSIFVINILLLQGCIYGARPSKQTSKKHLNAILNKTLKHANQELVNISKLKNKNTKYMQPKELENIENTLKQKRIHILKAQESGDIARLKNTVKKERLLVSLSQEEFNIPDWASFGHIPTAIIFENSSAQQDKLTKKRARFFKFKHCLWGANDGNAYVDPRYARAADFVGDTLTYMDIDKGDTPRHAFKKMHPFIEMPDNVRGFFKKYAFDESLYKFYMGRIYRKYKKDSVKKIQGDALASKALKYQIDILLKPYYIRPFAHDLLALIKQNKYLKNYVDYVKINTNITITELTKQDITPSIVVYPCLLPENQREAILEKIIKTIHHKFRNYAQDITYNATPTLSLKVKDFISLSGGNYFEKNFYKNVVTAGKCQNTVYTGDYAFFKNNLINIDKIKEALC